MPSEPQRIIAGAMSGTSADGVDVALTRIAGRGTAMTAQLIHHHHRPYDATTKNEIFAFRGGDATVNLSRLAQLARTISLAYATTVNEALAASRLSPTDLTAVAAHGQTLYHDPPNTIQWFDPSLVAAQVGCAVISDFRRADLAAGGQGAPLVPYADYILFRHPTKNRVLLNLGGIANFTWIPAGATIDQLMAFDTGPANCISDHLCRKFEPSGQGYDANGERALRAMQKVGATRRSEWVERFLADPYFAQQPPKSADTPAMIALFERTIAGANLALDEQLAIACEITARSVTQAFRFLPGAPDEILVSGGGAKNRAMMWALDDGVSLDIIDRHGIPADAKEAIAFALLAAATLDGEPSNVPSVTGAKRPVVLGSITPKP